MNRHGSELRDSVVTALPDATNSTCVVWHCRNLRTQDHPALEFAKQNYDTLLPVFIFDPVFYSDSGLACDARLIFLHECLTDLQRQYNAVDEELTFLHGNPKTLLSTLDDHVDTIITTADPTGRYGLQRDNEIAECCDITFIDGDGLRRDVADTRKNWSDHVESWLKQDPHTYSGDATDTVTIQTSVSPHSITREYGVESSKDINRTGGRKQATEWLNTFIEQLDEYPGNISAPKDARTGTSQLSPYLRFGCLSVREVYQAVADAASSSRAKSMFHSRLYWNKHYNQKLADWAGWMDTAVNPVLEGFHSDTHDPELVRAWKNGDTGYPMVDASMRCLVETGWLNFRMRAMCASFLCDLLQQPWQIGADFFYYHLLDADPAINYTQFQLQAGVDGTNMMRIYNPRKQVRDNDPDGEFITKWVPELEPLPVTYLDQPEKTPMHVQESVGVEIGSDYPYPVVEYESARQSILDKFESVKSQAKEALKHPEVNRRASLSQRSGTTTNEDMSEMDFTSNDDEGDVQTSLTEY